MLKVLLLGNFYLNRDGDPITGFDTPRLQSLLAFLILHRETPQSRASLAYLFWPDTSEGQARTNLRNLLHNLRRVLPDADDYIEINFQTLQWRLDAPCSIDVSDFENSLVQANHYVQINNYSAVQTTLMHAVSIYTGDLLPSCYDDWIIPLRETLRQSYLEALDHLIQLQENQRNYPEAIRTARRLLEHDQLQETTYRRLIRLHALNDDRASALRVYHTCVTVLQRELEVQPSVATREAYELLIGNEKRPIQVIPSTSTFSLLVGREKEWSQVLQNWQGILLNNGPHAVLICGEAGIGKTRLMEEMQQWTARQGIATASARCYAAEGDLTYSPIITWLRAFPSPKLEDVWLTEIARLLPEILTQHPGLPRPTALTEGWQRQRFFEALTRAILAVNQPLLLTIDDLQWCDRDTLEWMHFLLRFDQNARLLLIGTYRPEEVNEHHPLTNYIKALRLERGLTEIDLQPLDEPSTQILASQIAGMEISLEESFRLHHETEGNPLFIVEMMRARLAPENKTIKLNLPNDSTAETIYLPSKIRSILETRLGQLTSATRNLAGLAATIGRQFSFELLLKASGEKEEILVRQLDELWQRRIIREHGTNAYDFSHDKLRDTVYKTMSAARRRLLHKQVAQSLEKLYSTDLNPVSHQIAAHYEQAELPEQAIPFYYRAAKVARQFFANDEAVALLEHGITLIEKEKTTVEDEQMYFETNARFYEELGDILELAAKHSEALQAYQTAQIPQYYLDTIWQARLHRKIGVVKREQRLYLESLQNFVKAEAALRTQPVEANDLWWDEWIGVQIEKIWTLYWLAKWRDMEELLNNVKPAIRARGTVENRERFLIASCLVHLRKERYTVSDTMLANSREALTAALEIGSLKARLDCQFELGFLLLWRREFTEAEEHLLDALQLSEDAGILPNRTLALTYLTVVNRFQGNYEGVNIFAQRARDAAVAANMPDYIAAAKGNEAWLALRKNDFFNVEKNGKEALAIWRQSPLEYPFQWMALWPLIGSALAQAMEKDVWEYVHALLEPMQQRLPDNLNNFLVKAVEVKVTGQDKEAIAILEHAAEIATELGFL